MLYSCIFLVASSTQPVFLSGERINDCFPLLLHSIKSSFISSNFTSLEGQSPVGGDSTLSWLVSGTNSCLLMGSGTMFSWLVSGTIDWLAGSGSAAFLTGTSLLPTAVKFKFFSKNAFKFLTLFSPGSIKVVSAVIIGCNNSLFGLMSRSGFKLLYLNS